LFAGQLLGTGRYARVFTEVVFAVLDRRGDIIRPFADVLGSPAGSDVETISDERE
jgi:hypothetical protein